jgi:LysM repeat protein
MNKKVFTVLLVTVACALLLSACRLPASSAPSSTATPSGELPFPVATTSDLVNQILASTQTAIAAGSVSGTPQLPLIEGTPTGGTEQSGGGAPTTQETPVPTGDQTGGGAPTSSGDQTGGGTPAIQPTAAPTFVLPPAPTQPATYTLQKGEFPFCIARRYNIDPSTLLSTNNLGSTTAISIGFTLTLPQGSSWSGTRALHAHPAQFTVRSGDTLNSIACYYGDVYPEFIAAANGLTTSSQLTPGQVLNIP